jgi:hypothetical protein
MTLSPWSIPVYVAPFIMYTPCAFFTFRLKFQASNGGCYQAFDAVTDQALFSGEGNIFPGINF